VGRFVSVAKDYVCLEVGVAVEYSPEYSLGHPYLLTYSMVQSPS